MPEQELGYVLRRVVREVLAEELVAATKRIVGEALRIEAIAIGWDEDVSRARKAIEGPVKPPPQSPATS